MHLHTRTVPLPAHRNPILSSSYLLLLWQSVRKIYTLPVLLLSPCLFNSSCISVSIFRSPFALCIYGLFRAFCPTFYHILAKILSHFVFIGFIAIFIPFFFLFIAIFLKMAFALCIYRLFRHFMCFHGMNLLVLYGCLLFPPTPSQVLSHISCSFPLS